MRPFRICRARTKSVRANCEVSRRLTFWQTVGAFTVGTFVVIGGVGSFLQGWASYHDWACRMGWYTFFVTCVPMT
jgi:hypothetical protein